MDVTSAFSEQDGALVGLVDRLRLRNNAPTVTVGNSTNVLDRLKAHQLPERGPEFSGRTRISSSATRSRPGSGSRWSTTRTATASGCRTPTGARPARVSTARPTPGSTTCIAPRAARSSRCQSDGSRPSNMAQTTLLDGRTVDYVVRRQRGTIDRFIYSYAMLAPFGDDPGAEQPDTSLWNKRLIFTFDGGVADRPPAGHTGRRRALRPGSEQGLRDHPLVGHRTSTHYNLQLGGEAALMTKEEFIERYGVPLYTVAVGGSGGAIQQYVCGQNYATCSTPASRSTRTPTWSPRRSTSATASCSSATWTSTTAPTRSGRTGTTANGSRA